jgi:hypothetical protein
MLRKALSVQTSCLIRLQEGKGMIFDLSFVDKAPKYKFRRYDI